MIKFETKNGKSTIEMEGNTRTLFADLCSFVSAFHNAIKEDDKETADFFEWFVRNELGHVIFDECEEDDEPKKDDKKEEEKGDIADDIEELIVNLEELVKLMKK